MQHTKTNQRHHHHHHILIVVLGLGPATACMTESSDTVQGNTETDTDGILTGYVEGEDDADDDVDVTGAPEDPVFSGCLLNDNSDETGFRHQCSFEYDLLFTWTHDPEVGSAVTLNHASPGIIQTVNDSSYEHPMVAACCTDISDLPDFTPGVDDSCATPHHVACISDLIEHVCLAPGPYIDGAKPFGFDFAYAEAKKWLLDHRQDCYDHLWAAVGGTSMNACELDDVFDSFTWAPSKTVQGSLVDLSNFKLTVTTNLGGDDVPLALPGNPIACTDPSGNNGEVPPFSDPGGSGVLATPVSEVEVDVVGPLFSGEVIAGSGEMARDPSQVQYDWVSGDLLILDYKLVDEAPTTVGTSTVTSTVEDFSLRILEPTLAAALYSRYRIDAGDATFHLQATVDGRGYSVQAANSTNIEFYFVNPGIGACPARAGECIVSRAFTIQYTDVWDDSWELDVPVTTWER